MGFLRSLGYVLFTGFIVGYFSEWMFWTGRPVEQGVLIEWIPTWLLYSFITFLFLAVVDYFRVRTIWAVFLAGAIYGWLLEGIIVQTTYDDFPLNISFTALAWHAIISVWIGWYLLPRLMRTGKNLAWVCIGLGIGFGIWSIGWWAETAIAPIESVALYNFGFGFGLMIAYVGQNRLKLNINRKVVYAGIILLAIYYALVTIPTQPLALIVMPILLGITLITLRKNRRDEPENVDLVSVPIPVKKALMVLWIPLMASLIYAGAVIGGVSVPSLQIVYVVLMPAGFLCFFASLYRIWTRRKPPAFDAAK